ncbi:MAG: arginine--tRNA ligase [Patescibacteria group bacterium]
MIRDQIKKDFGKVLEKLRISPEKLVFEHPENPEFGDYSTNIALKLKVKSQKLKVANPFDLANKIVNTWRSQGLPDWLAKIQVAPPGFINLWLKEDLLIGQLSQVLREKDGFGRLAIGKGKTVIVDYSSPNIAKPFGIGHLRSTIIGQALYNLYKFLGFKVIGDNHLGDWGTQFGKLIYQIKSQKLKVKNLTIEDLERLYVDFHKKAEENPKLEDEARAWFKKLEEGDKEARKIWQACVDISLREFARVYKLLGIKFDVSYGESFYEGKMAEVVFEAKKKGIAKESQGALIIPIPGMETPLMLLKSDGATTYETRELATIKYRKKRWHPVLAIWEVGADQKFHFLKSFAAAELLGYGKMQQFVHVPHGLIRWVYGKFSTRKGETIHLEEVLSEAIKRAEKIISESETSRGLSKKEKKEVAEAVGVGAVVYFDLSHQPETDIIFDWEKIFVLEGNSGPYLQYTYARCQSVLAKAKLKQFSNLAIEQSSNLNPEELSILRTIYKFPEVVQSSAEAFSPNLLCNFLFDLCQKYNLFYQKHPILKPQKRGNLAETQKIRELRLGLTAATGQVLQNGLTLLGIKTLERM